MMQKDDSYSRLDYRRLIAWPRRIQREWPFLGAVLPAPPARLLDLGSGSGEHARFLVAEGYEIVGVDRSPAMLEKARQEPLPAGLTFLEGDMSALTTLVEGPFDGALCLGNALPHLRSRDELRGFATGLQTLLSPNAPVVIQLLNYHKLRSENQRFLPLNFWPDEQGERLFLRLMQFEDDGSVLFFPSTLHLDPQADEPLKVVSSQRVALRGWRHDELAAELAACGFVHQEAFASFDGTPFDADSSHDFLLVARQAEARPPR